MAFEELLIGDLQATINNREQYIQIGNSKSRILTIKYGVP